MRTRQNITLLIHILVIILLCSLLSACGVKSADPVPDEGALDPIDLSDPGDSAEGEESDGQEPIHLVCPPDTTYYKLQLNHTFTFSPGGNKELMQVTGHTTPDAWCLISINGETVQADPCIVGYEYNGWIQGSDGKCDITGTSTALLEFDGECHMTDPETGKQEGVAEVLLGITEVQDPDADLGGALNCPRASAPYMGFYPPTFSVMSFLIQEGGASDVDSDTDFAGQFEYQKSWTLMP